MSAEASLGCTAHVVVPCVNKTDDLIIGVVDGGRSRDATSAVSTVLGDIVEEEYDIQQDKLQDSKQETGYLGRHSMRKSELDEEERLQYLKQSVLSCHRCVQHTATCCTCAVNMLFVCCMILSSVQTCASIHLPCIHIYHR